MNDQLYFEKHASHIPVIGKEGQERLRKARVHIAGFGGLGNMTAFFLAVSGVGYISANDRQRLETDNLSRFVCGGEADLGTPKVLAAARNFVSTRPDCVFEPIVAATEDDNSDPAVKQADWVVCASNTVSSRLACAKRALRYGKPLLDIAVTDGRYSLAGIVKYRLPDCPWLACPACYLDPDVSVERNEGLLSSVISVTAAMAAHLLVLFLSGRAPAALREKNLTFIQLNQSLQIETMAVEQRRSCTVCGGVNR